MFVPITIVLWFNYEYSESRIINVLKVLATNIERDGRKWREKMTENNKQENTKILQLVSRVFVSNGRNGQLLCAT
jgi:hypothetical protein